MPSKFSAFYLKKINDLREKAQNRVYLNEFWIEEIFACCCFLFGMWQYTFIHLEDSFFAGNQGESQKWVCWVWVDDESGLHHLPLSHHLQCQHQLLHLLPNELPIQEHPQDKVSGQVFIIHIKNVALDQTWAYISKFFV